MKKILLVFLMACLLGACEQKSDETAQPVAATEFSVVDGTSEEALADLNAKKDQIIEQVVARHGLDPDKVKVQVGKPSGLGITVAVEGKKKVKLEVPPSKFGAELVTNFDHTLDRAVRRAAGLDEK